MVNPNIKKLFFICAAIFISLAWLLVANQIYQDEKNNQSMYTLEMCIFKNITLFVRDRVCMMNFTVNTVKHGPGFAIDKCDYDYIYFVPPVYYVNDSYLDHTVKCYQSYDPSNRDKWILGSPSLGFIVFIYALIISALLIFAFVALISILAVISYNLGKRGVEFYRNWERSEYHDVADHYDL